MCNYPKHIENHTTVEWKDYYKLQYERIQQHESQRIQFSGFVIAGSLASIVLLSNCSTMPINLIILCSVIICLINVICAFFVMKSRKWIKFHQARAKVILENYNSELLKTINEKGPKKINSTWDILSRFYLQMYLHVILAFGPLIAIFLKKYA